MATTTRLNLYLPTNSDITDVTEAIADQMETTDTIAFATQCTSSTRPLTELYTGRLIFETDTRNIMRYNGSSWDLQTSLQRSRGRLGFTNTSVASASVAANAEIGPLLSLTFDAVESRRYLIYFGGNIDVTAGNDAPAAWRIRKANGSSVTTAGTLVGTFGADANDNTTTTSTRNDAFAEHSPNAGQITVGLFLVRPNNGDAKTVNAVSYQYLAIEDVAD